MGGRRVRVFHISDLHMRSADGPQAARARLEAASRWRVLGEKWNANLAELRKDGTPVDLVVFTGDLGDWGHPTDYPRALAFLKRTCEALAVPHERLFVAPGNHDIDRTIHRAAWESLRRDVAKDPRACSRWMAGEDRGALHGDNRRDQILEREQAFWGAIATELGRPELAPRHSPHGRLGYRQAVTLPGLSQPLQVIGLDTAWLAGDDGDSGQLRLTEHQVSLLTTTESGEPLPGFRLALMHHRLADLADGADARKLMADRVDLLLHGHQHEPAADVLQGPDHQLMVLATGCLYEGDEGHHYPNACQVIDLLLDQHARPRSADVRFRGWSERGMFWGDDALLYESARAGRLRLHRGARGWRFAVDGDVEQPNPHEPGSQTLTASPTSPTPPARTELIDFTIERQRHRRFVGREDVLAQLDEWLLGPGEAGWVVVTGGPGMGKSAVLAAWLARREAVGATVPHHFVRRQVVDWDQPERIAASLAAQIEAMFPALCDPGAKPEGRLIELLGRVSKRLGPSGNLVVLVDGLDETRAEPGDNPLPRFLPHEVPTGIQFLCATRPTYPHLSWIVARSPARRIDLDDRQWAASNEAVVRGFWETVATEYKPPLPAETRIAAIERAEGNVLHAVMLHDTLRGGPASERRADRIPRGLRGLIGDIWNLAASHESVRVGLGILCAAQEALSLDMLAGLAGWSYDERERFVPSARQLLLEEPASWAGALAYRPRHDWVRELMTERLGMATICAHHGTLARKLAIWPAPVEASARRYALRHALIHRVEAGDWADAWRVAAEMGFLEAKCREFGAHEAETDVVWAAERCHTSGDDVIRGRFDDLARALGRESHLLRVAPEATAALVWNRLRWFGWSVDELDQQLQISAGAMFLRLRHVATRESPALLRDLVGHTFPVRKCEVTSNGQRVVSEAWGTLKVWDLESGREVATLAGHAERARTYAVTPDGRRVVLASEDNTLRVWNLASGREVATLAGHANRVNACAVTPDGRCVVSASADHTLKVWNLENGREVATLAGHGASVLACTVTQDSRRVVSASADYTLKVWDLDSGREVATLSDHAAEHRDGRGYRVNEYAVTPDGRRVIWASDYHTLKVWDLESRRLVATLPGHGGWMNAYAVTPDSRRMVSASDDTTLKVWDLESGRELASLVGHAAWVNACAVTPDGRRVISASRDHTLKVWDLESGHEVATLAGHTAWVNACAVTPDGRRAVSASDDETLKVWDLESRRTVAPMAGHAAWVNACAVAPGGRRMVSASEDKTLKVWDLETGRTVATLVGHSAWVLACAVTPDGQCAVSASRDNTLKVWDLETGRTVATLAGHAAWVLACAVTPDGQCAVSGSQDRTLKVWDLESRRTVATLTGHAASVLACAVTPDGQWAVSASEDRTLKVWKLENGREVATLVGHAASVLACAVTPDGRRVVSASEDKTLKVWDLESGRALATLAGHAARVLACAVTPDGRRIVSASEDKTLKVWDLGSGMCLSTHRGNAGYSALATTSNIVVAGDTTGAVWFLGWPPSSSLVQAPLASHRSTSADSPSLPRSSMQKHPILFLAADPSGTDPRALDREARAIQVELERSGFRNCFELVTRWATEPLDLLRELRKLKPTVVHFCGHGAPGASSEHWSVAAGHWRAGHNDGEPRHGLFFQGSDGGPRLVTTEALEETFGAAGASVKLVVLSACYSEVQAKALLPHVGCVVGMSGSIRDDAARSFAIGFYGGLGERESVAVAYKQGCAAISLEGLHDSGRPQLAVRADVDASKLVLAADPQ